jgi:hypothetical protein
VGITALRKGIQDTHLDVNRSVKRVEEERIKRVGGEFVDGVTEVRQACFEARYMGDLFALRKRDGDGNEHCVSYVGAMSGPGCLLTRT